MSQASSPDLFKKGFLALGFLAAAGLLGYGLAYLVVMPQVSPGGFVPTASAASSGARSWFGALQAAFILLYAFALLPLSVMFTVKRYREHPYALVFAGSLLVLSLIIEIVNNLPALAAGIYPGQLESIPAEVLLYLRQVETIRYLSYDVAGFTIAYVAIFVYALVYFRSHCLLSYTILGSILLFIANVPCLWFAPNLAVILMVLSIFAFAAVPIFLARMAVDE